MRYYCVCAVEAIQWWPEYDPDYDPPEMENRDNFEQIKRWFSKLPVQRWACTFVDDRLRLHDLKADTMVIVEHEDYLVWDGCAVRLVDGNEFEDMYTMNEDYIDEVQTIDALCWKD